MSKKVLTLTEPTAFPGLNKKENKEHNVERDSLQLKTLKYKHFRDIMKYPEEDQMHHLMIHITSLSENDLGELTPDDAAKISSLVVQSMKSYMQLGQKIMEEN